MFSEKGIRCITDLQYLKEESDYEKIGLTRFEKYQLKDAISQLTAGQERGEYRVWHN